MKRRQFFAIAGATLVVAGVVYYLTTDKRNFARADVKDDSPHILPLQEDERTILHLASLAPSGHNTQPWLVKYIEPYHWIMETIKTDGCLQ